MLLLSLCPDTLDVTVLQNLLLLYCDSDHLNSRALEDMNFAQPVF